MSLLVLMPQNDNALKQAATSIESTVLWRSGGSAAAANPAQRGGYRKASGRFTCYTSTNNDQGYRSPLLHSAQFGPLEPSTT
jgi:hypothetical protein